MLKAEKYVVSEGAKKGYIQRMISHSVALLTYGCGA